MSLLLIFLEKVVHCRAWEEEALLFCLMFGVLEWPSWTVLALASIPLGFDIHPVLEPKKYWCSLSIFHKSTSNLTHSAITAQTFSMFGHNLHCALHSTLCSRKSSIKFGESPHTISAILHYACDAHSASMGKS